MTHEHVNKLTSIGFPWTASDVRWECYYQQLENIVQEHGHLKIPKTYTGLELWIRVKTQKYEDYRKGSKTSELVQQRLKKLENMGLFEGDSIHDTEDTNIVYKLDNEKELTTVG